MRQLFTLTADAFHAQVPDTSRSPYDKMLAQHTLFTKEEAEKAIGLSQDLVAIRNHLYQNACQLGRELRRTLRVNTPQEARKQALY